MLCKEQRTPHHEKREEDKSAARGPKTLLMLILVRLMGIL